ncbi:unnamed protein product [Effrenium voratum]|nr:unnamed protein product [Effrenium voratum]
MRIAWKNLPSIDFSRRGFGAFARAPAETLLRARLPKSAASKCLGLSPAENVASSLPELPRSKPQLRTFLRQQSLAFPSPQAQERSGVDETFRSPAPGCLEPVVRPCLRADVPAQHPATKNGSAMPRSLWPEGYRIAEQMWDLQLVDKEWLGRIAWLPVIEFELWWWWADICKAFLIFHCMVRLQYFEPELLERVVDRIECQYFSMQLGYEALEDQEELLGPELLEALRLFPQDELGTFQSLVNNLPLSHKVQLIVANCRPQRGPAVPPPVSEPKVEVKRAWKTTDPVEMEEWERERFFKGRWRVLRMPSVEAKVRRMAPGMRLRATLAAQLFQVLPTADAAALAEISQVCAFEQRLLHGDLESDFREQLAKRIGRLERNQQLPYCLAFAAALRRGRGPEAYRTWRKRLLPDLLWLMRAEKRAEILDSQRFVHPFLDFGLGHHLRAERSARLLVAVCGARQVQVDVELLDALCRPLEECLEHYLATASGRAGWGHGARR